jgi:hypothetical protein
MTFQDCLLVGVDLISIQKKEDPMSGRETILLKLCPSESAMSLYLDT